MSLCYKILRKSLCFKHRENATEGYINRKWKVEEL